MVLTLALSILKIILFVFLCIFAVILFILLIALFVPFSYKINAEKYGSIDASAAVSWLFGIIRFIYEIKGSTVRQRVKIFGLTVWRENKSEVSGKVETEKQKTANQVKKKEENSTYKNSNCESTPRQENINKKTEPSCQTEEDSVETQTKRMEKREGRKEKGKAKRQKGKSFKDNKGNKDNDASGTLKRIWEYKNKRGVLEEVFLLLKRLLRILMSFKLRARLKIGTGQPHTTGYIVGLCWAASGFAGADIKTEGDYENQTLLGSIAVKGRIFICSFFWAIILFVFNRNIFPIVKKLIFKKG